MLASLAALLLESTAPSPAVAELQRQLSIAEGRVVPAAEALPEDRYGFAPSHGEFAGVRTFLEQVKHVAAVNYLILSGIRGTPPPEHVNDGRGPDAIRTKADALRYLNDSYLFAHAAVAEITSESLLAPLGSGAGGPVSSRLGLVGLAALHAMDHYGQMAVYLRMNGVIPPATQKEIKQKQRRND